MIPILFLIIDSDSDSNDIEGTDWPSNKIQSSAKKERGIGDIGRMKDKCKIRYVHDKKQASVTPRG